MLGSPDHSKVVKWREEMAKEKEKAKVDPKELVEHTLVKNKNTTLDGGQKKMVLGGPRVKRGRKG